MARSTSLYVCQQCEYESGKWLGKCPECGEWNSFVESVLSSKRRLTKSSATRSIGRSVEPIPLSSIKSTATKRTSTKISELDRVLGGGIVSGQVILIAGEPGIGKSTILIQLADKLSQKPRQQQVLYVSGEESVNQLAIRGKRLGIKGNNIQLLEETDIDSIREAVELLAVKSEKSKYSPVLIVDSIQTMRTSDLSGMAGSVGQVRECTYRLVRLAKSRNIPIFIVGHVTKQGAVAGPAVLAHLVDTVLWFEGDKSLQLRLLRAVKNRFGPTDEVGIFSMEDKGLVSQSNPEKLFLSGIRKNVSGSVKTSIMQGTRPVLIELQSLVVPSKLAYPKRIAQGMDSKRLEMLLAVLIRRCGIPLYDFDCFVNITGGISVKNDPSIDLAVCLSLASAYFDKAVDNKTLAIGEVGLLGDIREVGLQEKRIREARRLGFKKIISNNDSKYLQEAIKEYIN